MARPEGFLWSHPGIPSLTVPYHDTNDFYYSGHVGTCVMYMLEFYANRCTCLTIYCFITLIIEWSVLTMLRTHYIIDLLTGVMVAHLAFINSEWVSYFADVKIAGFRGKDRNQIGHDVCRKCGWSNRLTTGLTNQKEIKFLKRVLKLREVHGSFVDV
mmetsp:Transcript_17896/g.30424  ORF Transcript_17896/g.30424 Transcript_17896/m.30424 type:complete len:157 (-) Transcript_17896:159-629(-)